MAEAKRGSQMWLQKAVNRYQGVLDKAIREAIRLPAAMSIEWVSPKISEGYREYQDEAALKKVNAKLEQAPLADFWPKRGPVWDALAIVGGEYPLFLEAKAHIAEAASPGTKAVGESKEKICEKLQETKQHYGVKNDYDWSGTFYQYANRLAHHYLVNDLNKVPSYLVFLYFLNADDMGGPRTREEWESAILLMRTVLGLGKKKPENVVDVFVDCRKLKE